MHSRLPILVTFAAVAIGFAVLGNSPETRAAYPGDNGRIAFAVEEGGHRHIWTMEPDGSDRQEITTGAVMDYGPRRSPDGTKIAFRRNVPSGGIFTVNADGSNLHFVPGTDHGFGPTWSPDGTRIAFGDETTEDIWTVGINGDDPENLTNTQNSAEFDPDWSPSGERIAFSRNHVIDGVDLWTMDTNGLNQQKLTDSPDITEAPSDWSPDGQWIVFGFSGVATDNDIAMIPATGGQIEVLANSADDESWPVFSPDGLSVAFSYEFDIQTQGIGISRTIAIMALSNHALHNVTLTDPTLDETPDWGIVPGSEPATHLWGDHDCSAEIDPLDALFGFREAAAIDPAVPAGGSCPVLGDTITTLNFGDRLWGDLDCNGVIDGDDGVLILKDEAQLPPANLQDCPALGIIVASVSP